jgi:HK97 family phage major capsid protein
MRNLVQIRDEIQSLCDTGEAILAIAEKENRDLSADEQSQLDAIYGTDKADGKLAALKAEESRMQRIDAERKEIAARRAVEQKRFQTGEDIEAGKRKILVPASAKRHGHLKAYASAEDAYVSGQFIAATMFGNQASQRWLDDHGIQAAHSTSDNSKGGYAVPEPMEQSIIRIVEERGVFRRNAFVYPMTSGSVIVPRRSGGFTSYYVGENSAITPSDLTLNQVKLEAKKLGVLTQISSELSEDAIVALADLVTQEIAYAFANAEDEAGFNGDGTSTYGGILGLKGALQAGSIQDAIGGNVSALTLDLADFEATVGKLPMFPGIQPKWYVHSAVYWASMARLMDAVGGNTNATLAAGPEKQVLGYPVEFAQVLPGTTGSSVSTILCYFGDLAMASTMGVRRGVTVRTDESVYFTSDAIAIRATERYDVQVHERGDASNAGAIVALKTAAS